MRSAGPGAVIPGVVPHRARTAPAPEATGEPALVAAIADGDQQAFRRLYLMYHRRLGGFLMRLTGRLDLTEELINDIMFVVWRKAGTFRRESQVSTWIMGIAYRQAMKALRRKGIPGAAVAAEEVPAELAEPDGAGAEETRQWIESALAALPAKQRMMVELAYFMGYSCDEISRFSACPVGTVKTRLHHARIRLRHLLSKLSGAAHNDADRVN
jgi:RNA polymerase sigma-70 factor, ECF subfamily